MGYSIFEETMVDMPWPEIEKAAEEGAIVLLPTAVIEEHGPHMGLGVDTYCGYITSKLVRRELEARGIKTLIAPPYYWGINNATGIFPGSFTFRKETVKAVLHDILESLKGWGFTHVFNINWHLDVPHVVAIVEAIKEAHTSIGIKAYCIFTDIAAMNARSFGITGQEDYILMKKPPSPEGPPPKFLDLHASAVETGIMMNYFPDQVDAELARMLKPTDLTFEDFMVWVKGGNEAKKLTPSGYFGNPAGFSPEVGRQVVEGTVENSADVIEAFMKGNYKPPEIE